jgi:Protein kinase domain
MTPDLNTVTSPPDNSPTRTGGVPPEPDTQPFQSAAGIPDAPPGFTLDREIGSGGMGVVYLAHQSGLNRTVALKTVRAGTTLDHRSLIRFLAEAEAVAAVRHPNVVEVYAFGEHAGRPFLALEYCPGGDLTTVTKAEQTRDVNWFRRAAELMTKIADGVNAAHALGIVHRDLKPANVLLAADGTPKVTDFGLAKRGLGSDLTHTTDVLGTPAYMAPEQASGRTKFVGLEADVWALGVMLYELLGGTRPFDAPNPLELIAAVAKADVPPLRDRFPTVPTDLALVTHKCLTADPRDRYPTAGAFTTDLRNWLDGKPVSARPAGRIESAVKWVKRNKRVALTGAGVLLVMATATGVSIGFGLDATEQRKKAEEEKQAAIDAKGRADSANMRTQRALARATISRIVLTGIMSMEQAEYSKLHWELVDARGDGFESAVLSEVVRYTPGDSELDYITPELLQSLTGLNVKVRSEVRQRLADTISDPSTPKLLRQLLTIAAIIHGFSDEPADQTFERLLSIRQEGIPHRLWFTYLQALQEVGLRNPHLTAQVAEVVANDRRSTGGFLNSRLRCQVLARLFSALPASHAEKVLSQEVKLLTVQLDRQRSPHDVHDVVHASALLIPFLTSSDQHKLAAELAQRAMQLLRLAFAENDRDFLAESLLAVIAHLPGEEAGGFATTAVELLLKDVENSVAARGSYASACARLTHYLPAERRKEVATVLSTVMANELLNPENREFYSFTYYSFPHAYSLMAPPEVDLHVNNLLVKQDNDLSYMILVRTKARFGSKPVSMAEAVHAAEWLTESDSPTFFFQDREPDVPHALEALCMGLSREELHRRKAVPAVVGGTLAPVALPKPNPLPPQTLVDLLKRPFVVREKQRAVLNALELTYDRRFKDLWEFVAFAEKDHPELDLLTPPKRPERK